MAVAGGEVFKVENIVASLPREVLDLPDLDSILSLETWNDVLSDDEREYLARFLPVVDASELEQGLLDLLMGCNVNFGSPRHRLWDLIKTGEANVKVATYSQGLRLLVRKKHQHEVRDYHNRFVNSILEMQKMWEEEPEVALEEKLRRWNISKSLHEGEVIITHESEKAVSVEKDSGAQSLAEGELGEQEGSEDEEAEAEAEAEEEGEEEVGKESKQMKPIKRKAEKGGSAEKRQKLSAETENGVSGERKRGVGENAEAAISLAPATVAVHADSDSDDEDDDVPLMQRMHAQSRPVRRATDEKVFTDSLGDHGGSRLGEVEGLVKGKQKPKAAGKVEKSLEQVKCEMYAKVMAPHPVLGFSVLRLMTVVRSAMLQSKVVDGEYEARSLPVIVSWVKNLLTDAQILDSKWALEDLVKQTLTILGTKAPPGTRLWKPFVRHRRATRDWSWTGGTPPEVGPTETLSLESHPASDVWGVSDKAIARLKDRFADSLQTAIPDPPPKPMPKPVEHNEEGVKNQRGDAEGLAEADRDENDSFLGAGNEQMVGGEGEEEDLPAIVRKKTKKSEVVVDKSAMAYLKSQVTLPDLPPEWIRVYQKEELRRYSTPTSAYRYTAVDGGKASVPPVIRASSKTSIKTRDHSMLKPERPPHVTVLCLVRDAAARFYKAKGTRADVCALIRFSQYFVRDTSDAQLHQVVSGAMDRLHYERDPCIKYDPDTRLWTYLHRDRREDEFDEDGMQSMRKWGPRKSDAEGVEVEVEEEAEGERGEEGPSVGAVGSESGVGNNEYGFDTEREDGGGRGMRGEWGPTGGGEMGSPDDRRALREWLKGVSRPSFGGEAETGMPPPGRAPEADWLHHANVSNGSMAERQVSGNLPLRGYGEWTGMRRMQDEGGGAGSAEYSGGGGYNEHGSAQQPFGFGQAGGGDGPHLTLGGALPFSRISNLGLQIQTGGEEEEYPPLAPPVWPTDSSPGAHPPHSLLRGDAPMWLRRGGGSSPATLPFMPLQLPAQMTFMNDQMGSAQLLNEQTPGQRGAPNPYLMDELPSNPYLPTHMGAARSNDRRFDNSGKQW